MNDKDFSYYLVSFFEYETKNVNAATNTITSYKYTFILLLEYLTKELNISINKITIDSITKEIIENFLQYLEVEKKNSISTINQRLAAIKSFFKYITTKDIELLNSCNSILNIKSKKTVKGGVNYLTVNGIKLLLSLPNTATKTGIRDLAIMTLLYDSATRVNELTSLQLKDISFANNTITVYGKGRKLRTIPILNQTIKIIQKYIKIYDILDNPNNLLFFNTRNEKLTRIGINYILNKYVEIAKKKEPLEFQNNVSPHVIRHSKAMHLLENEVNLIYIRDFLGHESVVTTEIYAKSNPEIKRKAIELASKPLAKNIRYSNKEKNDLLKWLKDNLK